MNLSEIIALRQQLHTSPELSDNEKQTASVVKEFISRFKPVEVVENIGGHGIAFIFEGKQEGPSVMFRCELDALPINELNQLIYRSTKSGISHTCGHDGHMAIMCGLAALLNNKRPEAGRVILLFQPSEETGQGALRVLNDPRFKLLSPDYVFALHNIPGYPKNTIVVKDGIFSSASIGIIIRLRGKTSHASEPEKGQNPVFAMVNILNKTKKYSFPGKNPERIKLITPIYCKLGEKAFGTNPGLAEMMFTLRGTHTKDFEFLKEYILKITHESLRQISPPNSLHMEYKWVEAFPNTVNDPTCSELVVESARQSRLETEKLQFPFRWSEDFGHYLDRYPGALFGIGAGVEHPALHNPNYDFPDELINTGIQIYYNIYKLLLR